MNILSPSSCVVDGVVTGDAMWLFGGWLQASFAFVFNKALGLVDDFRMLLFDTVVSSG